MRPARVLVCHCVHYDLGAAGAAPAVRAALEAAGVEVEPVADLCGLAARKDGRLAAWAADGRAAIVACYPRAVRWLMAWAGAPLAEDGPRLVNLREDGAAAALRQLLGEGAAAPQVTDAGSAAAPAPDGDWVPWFPVLDYDRCVGCGQCADFCLFGAFETDPDGRPAVGHPEKCKTNCPACGRVCPTAAIIFAKYPKAPINGAEPGEAGGEDAVRVDMASVLGGDVHAALRRRTGAEPDRDRAETERCDCTRRLAELVARLDIPADVLARSAGEARAALEGRPAAEGDTDAGAEAPAEGGG